MKTSKILILIASTLIPFSCEATVPWYALLGASISGARLITDPVSPFYTSWITRNLEWYDRPGSTKLSKDLKGLKERLATALKLMREDYVSPERQAKYDQYTKEYNEKFESLQQEKKDGKRSALSYFFAKNKLKKAYNKELKTLKIDKVSSFWAWIRWQLMVQNIWSSWWHCYKYSFNQRYSNLANYVAYVEGKLK